MDKLSRLQDLIKKTGDKIVLVSESDDHDLIIMPLSEYEKLIEPAKALKDMDEKELLNRINRDISLWKENQAEKDWEEDELNFNPPWSDDLDNFDNFAPRNNIDLFSSEETLRQPDKTEEKDLSETDFKEPWSEISATSDLETNEDEKIAATPVSPENNVINYENIPPPPDIIMPKEDVAPEKIIDLSLEEEPEEDEEKLTDEFNEEPVY